MDRPDYGRSGPHTTQKPVKPSLKGANTRRVHHQRADRPNARANDTRTIAQPRRRGNRVPPAILARADDVIE